ncbi:uncharacterized protein EDB93DRAFT_1246664 [Suillus bovinus]|uniref:uncharacterized protein n=1 Tax=Suillus bovinus TaxID=48563 RepID=UPI001B866A1D|nr:uncharacterized protein EDB93DRAFT_1246664 [Suillus bovinus]KAG2157584.1 hypothetical protein EDB93DRAFT_1246664 [Suillus bovinus]
MSPPVIQYVVPKEPTILAGRESVDLPGYDLWLHFVDNVHAFDGSIDIKRFHDALASTLQMYPHAAGKLCTTGGRWFIQLTNSGLAVEAVDRKKELSTSFIQGDWVIQDDLSPLLSQPPPDATIVNGSASLVRFKITAFKDRTILAVSWHHTLGDAVALFRFMKTLSLFYQGADPDFSPPTFDKHQYRTPEPSTSSDFLQLIPHLWFSYPFDELQVKYAEACEDLENLRWRFHEHHLHALHSMLSVNEVYLSRHDCLTAYMVTLLNRSMPKPIRMVTNVANFRRVEAHYIANNVAGNAIQNISTATLPSHMRGIAIAVRESIVRCRDQIFLEDWMAVTSDIMLATANAGKYFLFASRPNVMTINSNIAIDWCDAHFGFPDSSSFFTTGSSMFYFRPFKSNPALLCDGTWRSRKGSVDVSMGVPRDLKTKLVDRLALDFETILYRSPRDTSELQMDADAYGNSVCVGKTPGTSHNTTARCKKS